MMMLDIMTWFRFIIWLTIGLTIYLTYGLRYSKERARIEHKIAIDEKRHEGSVFTNSREILVATGQ